MLSVGAFQVYKGSVSSVLTDFYAIVSLNLRTHPPIPLTRLWNYVSRFGFYLFQISIHFGYFDFHVLALFISYVYAFRLFDISNLQFISSCCVTKILVILGASGSR